MTYLDDIRARTQATQSRTSDISDLLQKFAEFQVPQGGSADPASPVAPQAPGIAATGSGYGGPQSGNVDTQHVDPRLRTAVEKLIAASHGQIGINSGYRDNARQAQLYAAALKKYGSPEAARKWVAPPGHSRHNEGEAIDLALRNAAAVAFAHQHAAEYGLTFPLSNENWHVELNGPRRQ